MGKTRPAGPARAGCGHEAARPGLPGRARHAARRLVRGHAHPRERLQDRGRGARPLRPQCPHRQLPAGHSEDRRRRRLGHPLRRPQDAAVAEDGPRFRLCLLPGAARLAGHFFRLAVPVHDRHPVRPKPRGRHLRRAYAVHQLGLLGLSRRGTGPIYSCRRRSGAGSSGVP